MQYDVNKQLLKVLSFYGSFIDIHRVKKLSNVELLKGLPFYDDLSIIKNKTTCSGYSRSYKVEIVDKKDVILQLKSEIILKICLKNY